MLPRCRAVCVLFISQYARAVGSGKNGNERTTFGFGNVYIKIAKPNNNLRFLQSMLIFLKL